MKQEPHGKRLTYSTRVRGLAMRGAIACCGLLIVALGWCIDDPLQQRVSYDKPGQTLKSLLRDLSAQTNLKLYAAPPLDTEIVLVAVQDMPLQTLMEHIAYVVDGEWIAESERQYRLARTPKVIKARTQQDREQALADLREMLASEKFRRYTEPLTREEVIERTERIRKQLREIATEEREYESLWRFHNNLRAQEWEPLDPQRRLLCRILQQIDLQALVDIPLWERRVFSNMSGRYLLPLRMNLAPLLQQWQAERETFEKVLTSLHHQFTESDKEAMEFFWWKAEIPDAQSPPERRAPTKVYLEARRVGAEAGFRFALYLADDEGRVLASTEYPPDSVWEGEEQWYKQQIQEDATLAKLVEWREQTRQWLEAWGILRSRGEVKPFPELLDPAKHEPLQFVATDVLRSYARHRELALVALLDDWMLFWRWSDLSGEPQPLVSVMTSRHWLQMSVAEGVLRVKPRFSSLHWGRRESRDEMSRWIQRIVERSYITLEDAFNVANHRLLAERYMLSLVPGHISFMPDAFRPVLPLLKRWAHEATARPEGELQLPLRELAPTQLQQLERIVYNHPRTGVVPQGQSFVRAVRFTGLPVPLPHAHLPDGLPRDALLHCTIEKIPGVLAERSGVGVWGGFSPRRWLQQIFQNEGESEPTLVEERERIQNSLLLPAQREKIGLSVRFSPTYELLLLSRAGFEASGYRLTQGFKPMRWDEAQSEILKSSGADEKHNAPE
jgi:hypothetical protein